MSEKNKNEIPHVGEIDPSKETSPIVNEEIPKESSAKARNAPCWYNGRRYSTGAKICASGRELTCQPSGSWGSYTGNC